MKTTFLFPVFFLFSFFATAQDADSLAVAREVDSLIRVSRALTGQRDFDKALEVNIAAEKLALEKLGRETAAYGSCCFNRGRVYYFKTEYAEAEKWYLESKAIRAKALGMEHPDYAWSLNNLAILYKDIGQYKKAEPLFLESKSIREKALGKKHPDYASSLNNLAIMYSELNQFERAELIYIESKAIREIVLGREHPNYASTLNNLAVLYENLGQYEKAEVLYLESKSIREKVLGRKHSHYALSLNNLGTLYLHLSQYEKAEPLYIEAKAIIEVTLGKEHSEYALILNNLATLYFEMSKYEKAEVLYLEAMTIRKKVLGMEHPDYSWSLNNLANTYLEMGQYDKAEQLYFEAQSIWGKNLGRGHPNYASNLNNLAALYYEKGQYEKVESLHLESKVIREKTLGKEHPDYTKSLSNLTILYVRIGQFDKAFPHFLELSTIHKRQIEKALRHLSERELNIYLNTFLQSQNQTLSFIQVAGNNDLAPVCYDNTIFYKGFLLNAANQVKRLAYLDSVTTEKFNLLKSYGRRLAKEYSKPIAERDSSKVAELEEIANMLEKDLARTVAGYGEAMRQVNWQEVQAALKPGEAAVEFVHYRYFDKKETDSTLYAALLLRPREIGTGSGDEQLKFIPLFEEKQLSGLFQNISTTDQASLASRLYATRGVKPVQVQQFDNLYTLIWKPLEAQLGGCRKIYYSPSGILNRINLAAIPVAGQIQALADRYQLIELGSTRQLVVPTTIKPAANDAVLFGGIAYDSDSTAMSQANAGLDSVSIASRGELSFAYTDSTLRTGAWNALPFTDREVSGVEKTLKAVGFQSDTRRGFAATEEAFKTLGAGGKASPRVLHLATHGFFFPDPKSTSARFETSPTFGATEPVFKISDHPMIRSGLILAGGNHAWQTGKPIREGLEDGILTAYEISQMNLSNTELVVLSACETGLGDIQGNEGVYGLQRAFKIAGAKYLIMSLWQVPDKQTSLLMTTFYKKWLEEKMEIPEAFRAAQKELREAGLDPYYWAGFVLVE